MSSQHSGYCSSCSDCLSWEGSEVSDMVDVGSTGGAAEQIADIYNCSKAMVDFTMQLCRVWKCEDEAYDMLRLVTTAHHPKLPIPLENPLLKSIREFYVLHDLYEKDCRMRTDALAVTVQQDWLMPSSISSYRLLSKDHRVVACLWLVDKFRLGSRVTERRQWIVDDPIALIKHMWWAAAGSDDSEVRLIFEGATLQQPPEKPVFDAYRVAVLRKWQFEESGRRVPKEDDAATLAREANRAIALDRHVHNWRQGHMLLDDAKFVAFFSDFRDVKHRGGSMVAVAWREVQQKLAYDRGWTSRPRGVAYSRFS